jgi:TPR repeat protein
MYDLGLGCAKNPATAAAWYTKAALAGNPLGENNLADMYLRGEGVPHDDSAAFSWFQKAAAQGHTGARIKLGYMYAQGRGTAKDPVAAYSWITAAALAGDPRGGDLLYSLEKSLSAEQKAQAKQQASTLRRSDPQLSATGFAQ